MKQKVLSLALALLLIVTALSGCGGDSGTVNSGSSSSEPRDKDKLTLYVAADISSFDPTKSSGSSSKIVTSQIYDPLIIVDEKHEVVNRLIESYSISEDNLVYTFQLKQGVQFHNGEEMKAGDVVFSIDQVVQSPYFFSLVEAVDHAEAVSDYTVKVYLKEAATPIMESLAYISIMNEKAVTEGGEQYSELPIGTGPYKFVSYEAGNQVKLTRFDDYFRGPARIKDVVYRIIPDKNTATISLQTGEIDAGAFAISSYDNIMNDPNLVSYEWGGNSINYFAVNHEAAPFDNPLVRQALNYAVDREYILDVATEGHGQMTSAMLPEVVFGYSNAIKQTYTYDPEKAKKLLKQAGITTPMDIGVISMPDDANKGIAEALQQCLADVGLNTSISVLEQNKYFDETDSGNYAICLNTISLTYDADSYSGLFTADQINGLNTARYNNPEMAQLFAKARATLDSDQRLELYADIYNKISDDAVYIPLYVTECVFSHSKDLKVDKVYADNVQLAYEMHWD